jgi:hypothetical protein
MTEFLSMQYHQHVFSYLAKIFKIPVQQALYHNFAEFRGQQLLARLPTGKILHGEDVWIEVRGVLDNIDNEMRKIASRRSVAYWLHIYRRIGVFLSPEHESKTDHITIGLVRQIAEMAMQKYGLQNTKKEFGRSDQLSPNLILGGWMKRGLKSLGGKGKNGELFFQKCAALLRSNPSWVIRDFSKRDFIDVYALEGAAYQYWRITALLRSLGKGEKIIMDATGDWNYVPDPVMRSLIISIDKRNEKYGPFSSLIGVWIDKECIMQSDASASSEICNQLDTVIFPIYNTQRVNIPGGIDFGGWQFQSDSRTNFLPLCINLKIFFEHHKFMLNVFSEKRGYNFELLICVLVGLSSLTIFPNHGLNSNNADEQKRVMRDAILQTLTRGYHIFLVPESSFPEMLIERMSLIFSKDFDRSKVQAVVASLTLNQQLQDKIALWSNGPKSVIIPVDSFCVVDLVSVPAILQSIFVFMKDHVGKRGAVFEKLFKEALISRGFEPKSGELIANNEMKRELDAGVIVGNRMYLFECVSIERPLDYEIANPMTIKGRQQRLSNKLDQAKSLHEFVSNNPSGKNYDFSDIAEFVWIVVSPFVEWIWGDGTELWLDQQTPRILSPEEVFLLLDPTTESGSKAL